MESGIRGCLRTCLSGCAATYENPFSLQKALRLPKRPYPKFRNFPTEKSTVVEFSPLPRPLHGKFSCRNFSEVSNRESQKFGHNFYSKMPFRAQLPPSSTRKIFLHGICETFVMVSKQFLRFPTQFRRYT